MSITINDEGLIYGCNNQPAMFTINGARLLELDGTRAKFSCDEYDPKINRVIPRCDLIENNKFWCSIEPEYLIVLDSKNNYVDLASLINKKLTVVIRYLSYIKHARDNMERSSVSVRVEFVRVCNDWRVMKDVWKIVGNTFNNDFYISLAETLRQTGSYVAGSYFVRQMLGLEFTDMDVFCRIKDIIKIMATFENEYGALRVSTKEPRTNLGVSKKYVNLGFDKLIDGVLEFEVDKKKIQLICVNTDDVAKYIDEQFDISVAKIKWGGKGIMYPDEPNFMENLLNMKTKLFIKAGVYTSRYLKYKNMGFEFEFVMP